MITIPRKLIKNQRLSLHDKQKEDTEWKEVFKGPGDTSLWVKNINLPDEMVKKLWEAPLEVQPKFKMYGKEARMRRNIGFFSDSSEGYRYTGQTSRASPLTPEMQDLLDWVNGSTGQNYNGLLFNLYVDGSDSIGAHRDDETSLGNDGVIALSLGQSRKFRLRDYRTKKILVDYVTGDCELMWMRGDRFHKDLTHEVPVEKRMKGSRLSITFRNHRV